MVFFSAVFVWLISGICAVGLKRLSENTFKKIKLKKTKGSYLPDLTTNIVVWIPIFIAGKIEWSDPYGLIAGFTVICGFMMAFYPSEYPGYSVVYIAFFILVSLGSALFDLTGIESYLETKTKIFIISSSIALGYVVGDITKKSRLMKNP